MKRKLILCSFIMYILTLNICYASIKTYPRDNETLSISEDVKITSSIKSAALATPYVDSSEKIYDFADLFTYSEEKSLYNEVKNFIDEYNLDLAIVTIDTNNKSSAMAYADDFYDYNDFGIGSNHDGMLFLIDMDNRELWISTTGDAMKKYPDSAINKILDDCTPYATDADYYTCATKFINFTSSHHDYKSPMGIIIIIIASIGIPSVFCAIVASRHKSVKLSTTADKYLDRSTFNLTKNSDIFIRTFVSKTRRSSSSSGGGSHFGSSGRSHGGGGRRILAK